MWTHWTSQQTFYSSDDSGHNMSLQLLAHSPDPTDTHQPSGGYNYYSFSQATYGKPEGEASGKLWTAQAIFTNTAVDSVLVQR